MQLTEEQKFALKRLKQQLTFCRELGLIDVISENMVEPEAAYDFVDQVDHLVQAW